MQKMMIISDLVYSIEYCVSSIAQKNKSQYLKPGARIFYNE